MRPFHLSEAANSEIWLLIRQGSSVRAVPPYRVSPRGVSRYKGVCRVEFAPDNDRCHS
jgi:hypothetical protein